MKKVTGLVVSIVFLITLSACGAAKTNNFVGDECENGGNLYI